ncbi:ubiquitin-like domain-containing protein [Streptomyces cinereospinus]|uniref:Ubiquitin-like domain-containing protein n=1 Tax=Streptomyces cinereospinus TaxID=285561 RepID=A0ABV5N534_9ACTN
MSHSQFETYGTYRPYETVETYGPPPGRPGFDAHGAPPLPHAAPYPAYGPDGDSYGDVRGDTYDDTHEDAYGDPCGPVGGDPDGGDAYADTYRPAYETAEPLLPRQSAPEHPAPLVRPRADGRAARRRRGRYAERPDASVRRLLPRALVMAFLAGGTTAFVAEDKAVELTVDGEPRRLHTFADDVGELLAEEGVGVGAHDVVAPAPGTELGDGDEIAVAYGRPVRLTLDGHRREVWTTARTVDEVLAQLGVRAEGAYLSTARSQRIGRAGLALDVRTERSVTVMADGRARTVRTNAATVGEAVRQAGITLRGEDTTSVPPGSFPRDGQTVTVLRITGGRETREEEIPFEVRRIADPAVFQGTETVEQAGQPGLRRITYALRTVNGVRQQPRRIRTELVREPTARIVKVGTRALPASVRGADDLDWQGLAVCESGGRPDAVDPSGTYGGLYQFDTRTWHSLGGTGRPQDAPAAEQTYRAKKLYVRRGASPWPHCGARLRG